MKTLSLLAVASCLLLVSATRPPVVAPASAVNAPITGDYLEARTASVFAGACHYNGELVTCGHDAVLAWNISAGSWNGTNLAGVKAVAAVASDENLGLPGATRQSQLVIDGSAAQAAAFTAAIQSHFPAALGTITSVRRGTVAFQHSAAGIQFSAAHFADCSIQPMPNAECCKQPNLVWYAPIIPLQNRKVGYTLNAAYTAGTLTDPWQRGAENSAFYGNFSF